MALSITRYKSLIDTNKFGYKKILTYIPTPTESEYKVGYIKRYFIQKANDTSSTIYEVSSDNFTKYITSPFYSAASMHWRLSGTVDEIKESNFKSTKLVSKKLPNLMMYLSNYLQFAKV